MKTKREIFFYKAYFSDFYKSLNDEAKGKIDDVLFNGFAVDQIPSKFFKSVEGVKGLFEIRIESQSNIFRIFCCFDKGMFVVLFNGFQKKSQKIPGKELAKAKRIMREYFDDQKRIQYERK